MTDDDLERVECGFCDHRARWSVANLEGINADPIIRAFACGRHLHSALVALDWHMDCVHLYDLSMPVDRS